MEGRARKDVAIFFILCSILVPLASAGGQLQNGFYDATCPRAEKIVAEVVSQAIKKDQGIGAGFLRLFFHDCFVNGCDASLLLDATPSGEKTEKESLANGKSLKGLEVIDQAKARLEAECPGIVSCADTLAFATRDGAVLYGVPHYRVAGGRRDGLVSQEKDVMGNIPLPSSTLQTNVEIFARKGLTHEEMVVLLGAHSIGVAHCPTFSYRVNNYNTTLQADPKLSVVDAANIKSACQRAVSIEEMSKVALPFDLSTPFKMDSAFYKHLLEGRGLIESDRALTEDPRTRYIVRKMALDERRWLTKFAKAMIRLGTVDVKTGTEGEIRKQCRFVNAGETVNSGDDNADSDYAVDSVTSSEFSDSDIPSNVLESLNGFIRDMHHDFGRQF